MATEHQVIKFVLVDFRGDWQSSIGTVGVAYKAIAPSNEIAVVEELPGTGTATTYHYRLPAGALTVIINDVIHVPVRCFKSEQGNTVKCG